MVVVVGAEPRIFVQRMNRQQMGRAWIHNSASVEHNMVHEGRQVDLESRMVDVDIRVVVEGMVEAEEPMGVQMG